MAKYCRVDSSVATSKLRSPFQGLVLIKRSKPRALPWAVIGHAVGVCNQTYDHKHAIFRGTLILDVLDLELNFLCIPKGAILSQPGAMAREQNPIAHGALKGRSNKKRTAEAEQVGYPSSLNS